MSIAAPSLLNALLVLVLAAAPAATPLATPPPPPAGKPEAPPPAPPAPGEYKLHDLVGVAVATIGFILAGAILMGGTTAKYVHLFERYRALTAEHRQHPANDGRKDSLRRQIINYRLRVRCLNVASVCMGLAILMFLVTVAAASLMVIHPLWMRLRTIGTFGLFAGLILIAAAVALEMVDTLLSWSVIGREIADLPDVPNDEPATLPS